MSGDAGEENGLDGRTKKSVRFLIMRAHTFRFMQPSTLPFLSPSLTTTPGQRRRSLGRWGPTRSSLRSLLPSASAS
jgi:hypothetical protein